MRRIWRYYTSGMYDWYSKFSELMTVVVFLRDPESSPESWVKISALYRLIQGSL